MEFELKKKLVIVIQRIIGAVGIVFCVLGISDVDNWWFRILSQASLGLFMLVFGINLLAFKKQRSQGYVFFFVSALFLLLMIYTITVGCKLGKL